MPAGGPSTQNQPSQPINQNHRTFLWEVEKGNISTIPSATAENTAPVPTVPHPPCSIFQKKDQELERITIMKLVYFQCLHNFFF